MGAGISRSLLEEGGGEWPVDRQHLPLWALGHRLPAHFPVDIHFLLFLLSVTLFVASSWSNVFASFLPEAPPFVRLLVVMLSVQ